MRCSTAQRALSAVMDGERLPDDVREHAATCPRCIAFSESAQRVRTMARVRIAEPVPDLVAPIMAAVRAEAASSGAGVVTRMPAPAPRSSRSKPRLQLRALVAAALVGALVGGLLVSGGVLFRRAAPASAARIPKQIAAAATNLRSYQATYGVTENNWNPRVPEREFDVRVAFDSPERFRVDVKDRTDYPAGDWPRNDTELRVNGAHWLLRGPDACVSIDVVTCAATSPGRTSETLVSGRPPFDEDAPMPTDVILPVTALAGSDGVDVVGQSTIDGRRAVEVELSAQDAGSLFAFFQQAGLWRPVYPSDRVHLWLDAESWFPLRYQVTAAPGEDRALWASRLGIASERAGDQVLDVRLRSLSLAPPDAHTFDVSAGGSDEGFRDVPAADLASKVGFTPVQPTDLAGLQPYRFGSFEDTPGEAILSYADGLNWLRIREVQPASLGPPPDFSEQVSLPEGGVAYYQPAADGTGRRLLVHSDGLDAYLESSLRKEDLLAVAVSMPVESKAMVDVAPGATGARSVPASQLSVRAGFPVLLPEALPTGAQLTSAQVETFGGQRAVRLVYSRSGSEPEGYGVRIYEAPGEGMPPATGNDQFAVKIRGVVGRWSPDRQELEWIEPHHGYVSIRIPGLELRDALAIASSLQGQS